MRRFIVPIVGVLLVVPFLISIAFSEREDSAAIVPIVPSPAPEQSSGSLSPAPLVLFNTGAKEETAPIISSPKDIVGSFREKIDQVIEDAKKTSVSPVKLLPVGGEITERPAPRSFTAEEAFYELWPESYRKGTLGEIQRAMRLTGFLKPEDDFIFDSPEDEMKMYEFMKLTADFAESVGFLSKEDVPDFKAGVDKLHELVDSEKQSLMLEGVRTGAYIPSADQVSSSNDVLSGFLKGLSNFFSVYIAKAIWVSSPFGECYKVLGATPAPGPNSPAFCCNCGIHIDEGVPIPVTECGPGGRGPCDIQLGCLNQNCARFPQAIWDGPAGYPPPTYICGCG